MGGDTRAFSVFIPVVTRCGLELSEKAADYNKTVVAENIASILSLFGVSDQSQNDPTLIDAPSVSVLNDMPVTLNHSVDNRSCSSDGASSSSASSSSSSTEGDGETNVDVNSKDDSSDREAKESECQTLAGSKQDVNCELNGQLEPQCNRGKVEITFTVG